MGGFLLLLFTTIGFSVAAILIKFNLFYIWKHKVDKSSRRYGGELVAETLKAHGVKFIFTLPGVYISPILVAAEKLGLRVIDMRVEATCVFAADAVGRLSGTVGVAAIELGPCITNTVTAVKNAQMAKSPLLLLGGGNAAIIKGSKWHYEVDQLGLFKPHCKFVVSVKQVRDIVPTLKKAFHIAQSGTPGPVFVEFPIDVVYPYERVIKESVAQTGPAKNFKEKIIQWYHLKNIYAGAWEPNDMTPLKPNIPFANSKNVKKSARLILDSKKPVFVLGGQATLPPTPVEEVSKALESIGIPCFLGEMSRGLLGANSHIEIRQQKEAALKEADLIVLAGAECDFRLSYGRWFNKKAKIMAINRNKGQLFKNSDMFWKPTLPIVGDVGTFLRDLSTSLSDYNCPSQWIRKLKERDNNVDAANRKMAQDEPEMFLNPLKVCLDVEEVIPPNGIVVADGGNFVDAAACTIRPRGPLMWLDAGAFGTCGVGAGFAIGAKLCRPESEVWIMFGDWTFGFSLIEFDTYVRHKIPIIALIGNNAGMTEIAKEQEKAFNTTAFCDLAYSDYHKAVEGLGAAGVLLRKGDDVQAKLKSAQRLVAEGKPVLVNTLISKTKFSLSA